jgi:hypothetical protein
VHKSVVIIHFQLKLKHRTSREFMLLSYSLSVMMLSRNLYCCQPALVFYRYFWRREDIESMGFWKPLSLVRRTVHHSFLISSKLGVTSFTLHNPFDNFTKIIQRMMWESTFTLEVAENKTSNSSNMMSRRRLGRGGRKWPRGELFLELKFKGEVWSVFMWSSLIPSTPFSPPPFPLELCPGFYLKKTGLLLL